MISDVVQMTDSETSCDSESMGNCGSVKISISKDENFNLLTVRLVEASDLSAKREVKESILITL